MYGDDADCRMVVQSAVGNSDVNGSMITNTQYNSERNTGAGMVVGDSPYSTRNNFNFMNEWRELVAKLI